MKFSSCFCAACGSAKEMLQGLKKGGLDEYWQVVNHRIDRNKERQGQHQRQQLPLPTSICRLPTEKRKRDTLPPRFHRLLFGLWSHDLGIYRGIFHIKEDLSLLSLCESKTRKGPITN